MEDVSERYEQSSSMDDRRARGLMTTLAKMHSFFWKHPTLEGLDRGSFWVLERRRALRGEYSHKNKRR